MNALPAPGFYAVSARDTSVLEPGSRAKLKVGIALSSFTGERWSARFIEQLFQCDHAGMAVLIVDRSQKAPRKESGKRSALFRAFTAFDRKVNSRPTDALAACDLTPLLDRCRAIEVTSHEDSGRIRLQAANLDVIVAFDRSTAEELAPYASHGAWFVSDNSELTVPMFWASYRHDQAYPFTLYAVKPGQSPRVIYTSFSPTNDVSFHLGQAEAYWKAADVLLRSLKTLGQFGPEALEANRASGNQVEQPPSNLSSARYFVRWAAEAAAYKFNKRFRKEHWFVAYRRNEGNLPLSSSDMTGFRVITPPGDRFYADPFAFEKNGRNYLFFEDYRFSLKRGLLSFMEVDGNLDHGEPEVILDLPYHLSYPSVFEHDGEIFLVPETGGNRTVELYRATDFPRKWRLEKVLLNDVPAVDPTIFKHPDRFWMFVGGMLEGVSPNDEVFLFWAESLLGPWHPHARNPVISDVRNARPAGNVFLHDGHLMRPAQGWDRCYGAAVSMNRIELLSETEYAETPIGRISPEWYCGNLGTHTFNQNRSLQVVDGRVRIFG